MAKLEIACENIPHMRLYFIIGRYAKIIQHLALVSCPVITSVRLSDFKFTVPEGDRLFSSQSSLAPFLD